MKEASRAIEMVLSPAIKESNNDLQDLGSTSHRPDQSRQSKITRFAEEIVTEVTNKIKSRVSFGSPFCALCIALLPTCHLQRRAEDTIRWGKRTDEKYRGS